MVKQSFSERRRASARLRTPPLEPVPEGRGTTRNTTLPMSSNFVSIESVRSTPRLQPLPLVKTTPRFEYLFGGGDVTKKKEEADGTGMILVEVNTNVIVNAHCEATLL